MAHWSEKTLWLDGAVWKKLETSLKQSDGKNATQIRLVCV